MGGVNLWLSKLDDRRRSRQAQALSLAVKELPAAARRAMLDALDDEELIVGGYVDQSGRVCPMLAAHRRGARTDVGSFPRAWDAFARARRPRGASQRELQILKALLEESLNLPTGGGRGLDVEPELSAADAVQPPDPLGREGDERHPLARL
jgi:hypothetical protein